MNEHEEFCKAADLRATKAEEENATLRASVETWKHTARSGDLIIQDRVQRIEELKLEIRELQAYVAKNGCENPVRRPTPLDDKNYGPCEECLPCKSAVFLSMDQKALSLGGPALQFPDRKLCEKCGKDYCICHLNRPSIEEEIALLRADLAVWKTGCENSEGKFQAAKEICQARDRQILEMAECIRKLEDALDRDKTGLGNALATIREEVKGRRWIVNGRGSYTFDDDGYREETGFALDAIDKIATDALSSSGKLVHETLRDKDCPIWCDNPTHASQVAKFQAEISKEKKMATAYYGEAQKGWMNYRNLERLLGDLRKGLIEAAGALENQSRQECHRQLMLLLGSIEATKIEKYKCEELLPLLDGKTTVCGNQKPCPLHGA